MRADVTGDANLAEGGEKARDKRTSAGRVAPRNHRREAEVNPLVAPK